MPPTCADGQANRDFGRSSGGAREQEIRDVRAGDDQDDAGQAQQRREGGPRFPVDGALPTRSRFDHEASRFETGHRLLAHSLLERGLDAGDDRLILGVHCRAGLLDRHARLEPREQIGPVVAPILEAVERRLHDPPHRDRHEHQRTVAHRRRRAVEPGRRDAHDGHGLSVDDQRLTEHARVSCEAALPVGVAQYDCARVTNDLVVRGRDQAAECRREPERRKVASRDEQSLAVDRLAVIGEVGAEHHMGRDAGKDLLRALEISEHRIAEDLFAVAGRPARRRPWLGPWRGQIDQRPRILDRQRPEQELVEQREDGGVRADSQGQRQDRHDGHERCFEQSAEGESQLSHGGLVM